jgi:hypothetical protein
MKPAAKYAHVAQMLRDIKRFHSGGSPAEMAGSNTQPPTIALVRSVSE